MKVIKVGKIRRVECDKCKSLLEYDLVQDIKTSKYYMSTICSSTNGPLRPYKYIECPVCKAEINISKEYYKYLDEERLYEIQAN